MILLCTASDNYIKKYKSCIISQQEYCNRNNYKYILIQGTLKSRNWKRAKIEELHSIIDTTDDDILLIDGDCYIKNNCPPLDNFLNKDKSIYYANGKSGRLNSGFLYFKNNLESKNFVRELLKKLEKPVPRGRGYFVTKEGENGHIIWLKDEYEKALKNIFQEIPKLWNCSSPILEKEAYVLHFTNDLKKGIHRYNEGL